jgi:outer membrane protein
VVAELNVFDGFRTRSASASTKAQWEAAQQEVQKVQNQLHLDLRQAFLGVQEAKERMGVSGKSLESAEEALRITQEQYKQGAAELTMLLTAQLGHTSMRTRLVAAQYDYLIARSNLERAKGELVKQYNP